MSFNAQIKQLAQEAVGDVKAELLAALEAAEARIETLEAKLGAVAPDPDVTETAAKAPRRGRKPAADPEPPAADAAAEAAPAAAVADTSSAKA